eukprot:jgi/Astpho2/8382/e_gw1.00122.67.1_t
MAQAKASAEHLARQAATAQQELCALRLQQQSGRLGQLALSRDGPLGQREYWEDGSAFQHLQRRADEVAAARKAIEAARQASLRRGRLNPAYGPHITPEDYVAQDEIFKARLAALKREEDHISKEHERLEAEKLRHVKEFKRLRDQESSRWCGQPVLSERYLLMSLLGKGGFSEVFKGYDLQDMQEVAVKMHGLHSNWSDSKKASYVKHAVRESRIHQQLRHPRVVACLDLIEVDSNTFASILELCPGGDLDSHLQEHQVLPEKEARAITSQIFAGLAYLNEPGRRFIHYDLKPANILFNAFGEVKIADFGLSKVVEEGQTRGMELTSQGVGTYWYLPPECFEIGTRPPTISNKVDVWSVGVILYQMLYGRRPFGEGVSQEMLLRDSVMLNANTVTFPSKPAVSAEGKDFINRQAGAAWLQSCRQRCCSAAEVVKAVRHPPP